MVSLKSSFNKKAKNITFQHFHFNKKFNNMNSIFSNLTITIHYLLFKQLYFLSPPFFLSAGLFFFSPSLSAFFLSHCLAPFSLHQRGELGRRRCRRRRLVHRRCSTSRIGRRGCCRWRLVLRRDLAIPTRAWGLLRNLNTRRTLLSRLGPSPTTGWIAERESKCQRGIGENGRIRK